MRFSSQAMGKLLQVCNDAKLHLRVINLLVESAKQIKQLSGVQQLYAIEVLDYAMVQILHPSKRKLFIHTSGFSDSMESLVLEVCNLKCNARCANCETPDNIADFFIHQWNTLSTIYAKHTCMLLQKYCMIQHAISPIQKSQSSNSDVVVASFAELQYDPGYCNPIQIFSTDV